MKAEAEAKAREAEAKQAEMKAEAEARQREAEARQREAEASKREAEAREGKLQAALRRLESSVEGRGEEVRRAEARERELKARERNLVALLEGQGQKLADAVRAASEEERARAAAAAARSGLLLAMLKNVGDRAQNATDGEPIPDLAEQSEVVLEVARANAQDVAEMEKEIELSRGKVETMRASLDLEKQANRSAALDVVKVRVKFLSRALASIASETGASSASNLFGLLDRRSKEELVQDILARVDKLNGRQ